MTAAKRQEILDCIESLYHAQEKIQTLLVQGSIVQAQGLIAECQELAITLGNTIESLEGENHVTVIRLEEYCECLFSVFEELRAGKTNKHSFNIRKIEKSLNEQLLKVENSVKQDIMIKKEIVFLPYNASMWGSLEGAWMDARDDETCNAYVIPIPYFDKNPDGSLSKMHYEGDVYPDYVPIIDWQQYSISERRPDVIYIHNPYDNYNYVTTVHPSFYAKELRKYTGMLIYIPYFIGINDNVAKHFCTMPGVLYANRVIVESENIKKIYIDELREFEKKNNCVGILGDLNEKIQVSRSSKIDRVKRASSENVEIPDEWRRKVYLPSGEKKKIVLYNTTIATMLQYDEIYLDKLMYVLKIFQKESDKVLLLWRPHPLLKSTLKSMRPNLYKRYVELETQYKKENWGLYDESADIERAIVFSDAYYGDWSSVVEMYKVTKKPIMIANPDIISIEEIKEHGEVG